MKFSMKRLGALMLALVMVIGLIPVMNNAVNAADVTGLTDKTIGVSFTKTNNPGTNSGVTAPTGDSLTIIGSGKKVGQNYIKNTTTVTIQNNKTSDATLSFDYVISGAFGVGSPKGSVVIGDTTYTNATSGSFSVELPKGESLTIKVNAPGNIKTNNEVTLNVTKLALVAANAGPVTATFEAPAYGSYTVAFGNQPAVTLGVGSESQSFTNDNEVAYTLTATPGEGYKLVGWYNAASGEYLSAEMSVVVLFDQNATVKPIIVPNNTAVFMVDDIFYADLNEAVAAAQKSAKKQVTLVQSGVLPASDSAYVIPAGITLLIPRDTKYTPTVEGEFGPEPDYDTAVQTPYAFVTLTLESGAMLDVYGILDVEAEITTAQGSTAGRPYGGRPIGPYGAIKMSPESDININAGAEAYVWGYIYGEGTMNAYNGAKVYEVMQVLDFPGGSNMAGFADSDLNFDFDDDGNPTNDYIKTFPFSQYYVQNVEVALNLYNGAEEYVFIAMTAGAISKGMPVLFIGDGGMFCAVDTDSYITKKYNATKDRLEVTVNGDASMAGITLDMTGTSLESLMLEQFGSSKLDSNTYILSLNSNITITIASGVTTVKQDLSLLPGVELRVNKDAKLTLAQREFADGEFDNLSIYGTGGYNIYLWDLENWGKFAFGSKYLIPVSYSPSEGRYTRAYSDLCDVKFIIDGVVEINGFVYSTVTFDDDGIPVSGGAEVTSTGTGKLILMNGCGVEDVGYCLDGSSSCDSYMAIDSIWLQNADGSFVKTQCDYCSGLADASVEECQHYGVEYNYCDVHGCWYIEGHGNCVSSVEITWIVNGEAQPMEIEVGAVPVYPIIPSKDPVRCTVYTFAGWATTANGQVLAQLPVATVDAVYYAVFTESVLHKGDLDQNHYCDGCGAGPTVCVDSDMDHYCDYTGCDKKLSNCVDADEDHYCDYAGCKDKVSDCSDAHEDHYCDYAGCDKKLSNCVDADEDHYCDYANCNVSMSDCIDTDNDHYCDYAGCGQRVTDCQDNNRDHYCDIAGCGDKMTNCVDNNRNHLCDYSGCNKVLSNCTDADGDHYCDYSGCYDKMSDCADSDNNHYCDYADCGKKLTNCVDANADHYCDYAGCGDKLSNCKDSNNNHLCDYAGCGQQLTVCSDGNEDHKCDYSGCNKVLSNCTDADGDHYCDYSGCNNKVSNCSDANEDHYCDYAGCQENLTECVDADENHYCDYAGCGLQLSECLDDDRNHYCDYAGCGLQMTVCQDNNRDHYCDFAGCGLQLTVCQDNNENHMCDYSGCNKVLSTCVDTDDNHYCDYAGCNKRLSDCVDNDFNHYCDYAGCGAELTVCEDIDEDHFCDYNGCGLKLSECYDDDDHRCNYDGCGKKLSDCTPGEREEQIVANPGCEDGEKLITIWCEICGEIYSEETESIPALGHGHDLGWDYLPNNNAQHQKWCADCWEYCEMEDHNFVNHACPSCGWEELVNIKFYNGNELWAETNAHYGKTLGIAGMPIPAAPTGYQFTGWYTEGGVKVVHGMIVTSDIVAYAEWEKLTYTVTWIVDGTSTDEVYEYGATPSFKGNTDKAADGCTAYTFTGWDKEIVSVTGPMTYTAQYESGISHIGEVKYTNNGNGTHNGAYDCCGTAYVTNEAHIYVDGVCACGQLEHICADNLTFHAAVTPNCCNGGNNAYYSCSCGKFYADANASTEIAENSWILGKDSSNHTGTVGYTNNGADHTAAYSCCGESWNESHTYVDGTCVCGALKVSKLTVVYGASGEYKIELMVPYGTRLFDVVDFDVVSANMYVHSADRWGHYEQSSFYGCFDNSGNLGYLYYFGENYIMPDCDFYIEARYVYNGFIHDGIGWQYIRDEHLYKDVLIGVMMGDLYEGGSFEEFEGLYALDENGYRIENGLFRDYYIGEWINGVTYEPNAEDIAYYESKGMTFIDAEQTWYYFGADGKWAYNYTGRFGNSYIVNGHAAWHVGLVEIEGDYYYFKGDEVNGGNIMVTGDYYISRNNTDKDVVIGGLYTFGADGKLCWYNGITEVNGVLRYYEDGRLMMGKGLTQVGENLIYVNSYGELIVDAEYYIGANELGIKKGIYTFDANGFLVIPEEEPGKEGLHFEDGKWFYYVDGAKAYCAGLIQIDGNWVYVKSDGSLATGIYYVTNTNGHETIASGTKCTFDDNGVLIDPVLGEQVLEEGGIRDEFSVRTEVTLKSNGKLTIDVSNISMVTDDYYLGFDVDIYGADGSYYNELVRGEGVVEFDLPAGEYAVRIYIAFFHDAEDDEPGYGRGSLDYKITFTSDGTPLNGIVDGYYYVDGHIAYAAGLIEIDGIYYYVRSNGQIVTDCQYWITNVNDTGYEPGLYEFDADGWMYEIYVETFTGIKDGYFYIDDEVAYAAGLMQYNGGYIYVRSNGQVATGKYWITNHNDLLPEGFYDFSEDGIYYPAIPENAHLLMEVDKNVDTDGFWDSNAIANAVRASADGNLYIEVTDVTFEYESAGKGGFCIEFEGSYWVMQWDAVYKVGTGTVMIPVSAGEDVILFVNPADVCEDYVDSVYGTISYKVWSDVECELVQGGIGE